MNIVEVLIGGGALAYLVTTGLVCLFKNAQADVAMMLAEGLEDSDIQPEMVSQSPLFDENGWLR